MKLVILAALLATTTLSSTEIQEPVFRGELRTCVTSISAMVAAGSAIAVTHNILAIPGLIKSADSAYNSCKSGIASVKSPGCKTAINKFLQDKTWLIKGLKKKGAGFKAYSKLIGVLTAAGKRIVAKCGI